MQAQLRAFRADLHDARHYIVAAFVIFFISIVLGYRWEAFHAFLNLQIQGLAEVAEQLMQAENSMLQMFLFIFFNNVIKSIAIVYLGFLLGFLPIVFLAINGMVLGYLYLQMTVIQQSLTLSDLLIGILPHGIIELPAVIIACGFGMRLGALAWKRLLGIGGHKHVVRGEDGWSDGRSVGRSVGRSDGWSHGEGSVSGQAVAEQQGPSEIHGSGHHGGERIAQRDARIAQPVSEIKHFIKNTHRLVVFLIVSLFIAAVIETTITPWLLGL